MTWQAGAACALLALVPPQGPLTLDAAATADAVRIGRSSPADVSRFDARYRVLIDDDPVVRSIEIVTSFRRLVQLTAERVSLRDATWDERRAAVAARDFDGRLDLVLDLQFSPSNTYRTVPAYSLVIHARDRGPTILPLDTRATPRYLSGQPAPPGTPILAAKVRCVFDATRLDTSSTLLVGVLLDDKEVRRVPVDIGAMR